MAFREITVDTQTLAGDISELETALSAAEAQLEEMFNQVTVLDAMWDGPANAEFNRQFRMDHDSAKEMLGNVRSLIECMTYAREQYDICENDVYGIVSSIKI